MSNLNSMNVPPASSIKLNSYEKHCNYGGVTVYERLNLLKSTVVNKESKVTLSKKASFLRERDLNVNQSKILCS